MYDFYFRIYERLIRNLPPVASSGNSRPAPTPVRRALREALINCLVNADYYGRRGMVILRRKDQISLSLQLHGAKGADPSSAEVPPGASRLSRRRKTDAQKQAIAEYLTVHVTASCPELARMLGVKDARTRLLLREMTEAELVEPAGEGRSRRYRLKA